jgi:glycosyltransferase involved in cell wall biosynthesis
VTAAHPLVAVYRDHLLVASETYIRAQAETLGRYRSHYVCMKRVAGLEIPSERTLTLNRGGVMGRASETAFKRLGVSPSLVRAVRALRPAVLHAHMGMDGAVALPLARRLRLPLVVTFHGRDATTTDEALRIGTLRDRIFLRRREALQREARLFIAVSEFIRGKLVDRGFPADRIVVHYIGVDTEFFRPDPAVAREPVVLFVGRLLEVKGVTHLITAMREVQSRVPAAELVIIGRGPLRRDLERQAQEAGVRARFLGSVPPEGVRAWMNRATVFCMPSVRASTGATEAMPIVTLEAQAMALPVAGFASGGIGEGVADGQTALLASEGDSAALAANIEALLTDAPLWERMSAAAVARVRARFELRRQTAALEDLYDRARGVPAAPTPGTAERGS